MAGALLLTDDLFWSSKIVETARALGRPVRAVRSLGELEAAVRAETPACVILDLCTRALDPAQVVAVVRAAAGGGAPPRFAAFGRHTDADGLERARAAGCAPVLARSALQARLTESLAEWLA